MDAIDDAVARVDHDGPVVRQLGDTADALKVCSTSPDGSSSVSDRTGWSPCEASHAYLADEENAPQFAAAIEAPDRLVVPVICVLEVFKVVLRQRGERDASQAAALMQQGASRR